MSVFCFCFFLINIFTGESWAEQGKGEKREERKKTEKRKPKDNDRNSETREQWCILLQVLCGTKVRTRSLHRPTHQMSLQTQRAEQVKIETLHNTWLCVHVRVITCVCIAPLALHSTAICCWRNSSWQEITCNAVAMATYNSSSKEIQINSSVERKKESSMYVLRLCVCVYVSLCSRLWPGPVVPGGKHCLCELKQIHQQCLNSKYIVPTIC